MSLQRVQKILAQAGIASRRKAEELITLGEVTINGKPAKLGDKAEFGRDSIKVRGKLLHSTEEKVYLVFFKPAGVISMMTDTEHRATLAQYLEGVKARLFPIGRLDFNSEGLILLTNDGAYAEQIQRRDDIPRVYHVKIRGHVTPEMLERLRRGARIERRSIKPHLVRIAEELDKKARIEVVMMGSGAVDLKAYFEMKGFLVERIRRVGIGHLTLTGLFPGGYRMLRESQARALLDQPELGLKKIERDAEQAREADFQREKRRKSQEERQEKREEWERKRHPNRKVELPRPNVTAKPGAAAKSARPARPSSRPARPTSRRSRPARGAS